MKYVANHPYVNDPVRPGKVDRVIASTFAFGTTETFTERIHSLQELIPRSSSRSRTSCTGSASWASLRSRPLASLALRWGLRAARVPRAQQAQQGHQHGIIAPGFNQRRQRVAGRCQRYVAASRLERGHLGHRHLSVPVHDQSLDDSDRSCRSVSFPTARSRAGLRQRSDHRRDREHEHHGHHGGNHDHHEQHRRCRANVITYTAADFTMYNDRITGAANRSTTTDFAAPAIDVPTFRRTFSLVSVRDRSRALRRAPRATRTII